jgi:hypothetical protein
MRLQPVDHRTHIAIFAQSPNLFELAYEDANITYATGAFGGPARLHYGGPMGKYSFEGDQIQALRSARGREISVTLDTVSRFSTITLTVFGPDMELGDSSELSFQTIGIQATRRRSIAGGPGQEMASEALEINGLAKLSQVPSPRSAVGL